MRLIDAESLKELFPDNGEGSWTYNATAKAYIDAQPTIQPDTTTNDSIPAETGKNDGDGTSGDCISRKQAINEIHGDADWLAAQGSDWQVERMERDKSILMSLPSVQPDLGKYEYHYDHTDCIWYRPEARNRCPVTCAQYRDGWNDAMNYIFRGGKGYRPYRRGEQYEE